MIRIPVLILTLLMVAPAFGQTYLATWHYQLELQQQTNGEIIISYLIVPAGSQLYSTATSDSGQPLLPGVNGAENSETQNKLSVMNDEPQMQMNYQKTLNYFHYLNQHIPAAIILPEISINNRFPISGKNQYFPMPER